IIRGWPHARELNDDIVVLCPGKMRGVRWLGEESTRGQGRELAFIPLLSKSKIERARQHGNGPRRVGMRVGHHFRSLGEPDSRDIETGLAWIAEQHGDLRRSCQALE